LTLLLGLPLALGAGTGPHSCAPLIPVTFDSDTIPGLLGPWTYIVGASKYPPHLEELKAVKFAAFSFSPSSREDELDVNEVMRLNDTCIVSNTSKIQIFWNNSTLAHVEDKVYSMAELIQSDKDLLILKHINTDFLSVSLSARTPTVNEEYLEDFKAHLRCLGFSDKEIFVTS
ncbi:A1AG protein, partial [Urocolius indicus]|nr:A1AG protein [Urocolius indicus]